MDVKEFEDIPFEEDYSQEEKDELISAALKELKQMRNKKKDKELEE